MIANQKDIFISVFRGMKDDELYSFIRLLNLSSSILCKLSNEQVKQIIDELLDEEKLYSEDLLTAQEVERLSPTVNNPKTLSALLGFCERF